MCEITTTAYTKTRLLGPIGFLTITPLCGRIKALKDRASLFKILRAEDHPRKESLLKKSCRHP